MQYKTVYAQDLSELDDSVNIEIRKGFKPYGNPYVLPSGNDSYPWIAQAMVQWNA
jgi:hypothetical protein